MPLRFMRVDTGRRFTRSPARLSLLLASVPQQLGVPDATRQAGASVLRLLPIRAVPGRRPSSAKASGSGMAEQSAGHGFGKTGLSITVSPHD